MAVPLQAYKAAMLILNVIFFICGAVIMGIGIWAIADKIYISDVVGNDLFSSAAILMVFCGSCLLLVCFLGCLGAISGNRVILIIYMAALTIIFIILLATAIVAAVFHGDIEDEMKERMESTLMLQYGYSTQYNEENKRVTDAWDLMQTKLKCCAVEDNGWLIYRQSNWFTQYNAYSQIFVPQSCCVYEGRLKTYLNLHNCQSYGYGPPRYTGGSANNALHYQGCYSAAKEYLKEQSNIMLGIGFSFLVFLIAGIVCSLLFCMAISRRDRADFRS